MHIATSEYDVRVYRQRVMSYVQITNLPFASRPFPSPPPGRGTIGENETLTNDRTIIVLRPVADIIARNSDAIQFFLLARQRSVQFDGKQAPGQSTAWGSASLVAVVRVDA